MTDQTRNDNASAPQTPADSTTLPGLGSLFSAAASANARKAKAPNKGKSGSDQHEQRIGMAPRNTRRSMGKR
ncbi:MAG: hypothetical protein WA929_16485 [Pseudomonas neustonica]|tara:strand:- start:2272 stop:2487 length:216 start_codon:yes stop_codon:yes gene_type:complete